MLFLCVVGCADISVCWLILYACSCSQICLRDVPGETVFQRGRGGGVKVVLCVCLDLFSVSLSDMSNGTGRRSGMGVGG